ncbi:hypothetical protein YN1_3740 [Nanoarchaeota archaeon]
MDSETSNKILHYIINMEDVIGGIVKEYLEMKKDIFKRELELEPIENKSISIIGPRRSGKTYLLLYYFQKYREEGKNVIFFSFDDDRIYPPSLETFQTLIRVSKNIYTEGKIYYFLDEIQEVENWELGVKRLIEKEDSYVFITGSSSKLLSKEIATQLRGRTITYELFPFSFKEVIQFEGIKIDKYFTERELEKIKRILKEILFIGSFPEVIVNKDKYEEILKEYYNVMLFRDIIERWGIKNIKALKLFLKLVINNFSNKFSINRIEKYMQNLGIKISRNTLYNYLEYLSDAYIVFYLKKFSYSLREIEQSIPKIYPIDNGLINVSSYSLSENIGRLMENFVFLSLRRKYKENENIFYFENNNYEIDFLIKEGNRITKLINVSYVNNFDEIDKREIRSLIHSYDLFKEHNPELIIITWDYEDEKEISWFNKKGRIKFIPLYKWLLNSK